MAVITVLYSYGVHVPHVIWPIVIGAMQKIGRSDKEVRVVTAFKRDINTLLTT